MFESEDECGDFEDECGDFAEVTEEVESTEDYTLDGICSTSQLSAR